MGELMSTLGPGGTVRSLVRSMKTVRQFVFDWVGDAVNGSSMVKKTNALVKKAVKVLRAQAKEVTTLVKEANRLKPA